MDMDSLLIPLGIHTANDWNIEHGVAYYNTENFFEAFKHNVEYNVTITARNAWKDSIMDLYEWPDGFHTGSMYLEIEKEMILFFARELEQLGEGMSVEIMRQFFIGRYSSGVDYISIINYCDDSNIDIIIYISDPHQFIREMKRLQGVSTFSYNTADMLEFLSAGESEVNA